RYRSSARRREKSRRAGEGGGAPQGHHRGKDSRSRHARRAGRGFGEMTAALSLTGIVKRFGGVAAVDDVSLEVAEGEVLALVGENGAGKSPLISVACGMYKPDSGMVSAFGRELPHGDARAAIDAGVGVVYQHFMLVPPLTVWENVVLGREPRRH